MLKNRESNFDLLRILSAFAVVMLHVSGGFLQSNEIGSFENCHLPVMVLNHIVRFAVPCFFMMSGAFVLADDRNADYKYFYKKSFRNIGITGVVFCLLYIVYNILKLTVKLFVAGGLGIDMYMSGLVGVLKNALIGSPFFHLWYLFTLVGLYLAAPFVIRLSSNLFGGGKSIRQNDHSFSYPRKCELYNK